MLLLVYQRWDNFRSSQLAKETTIATPVVEKDPYDSIQPPSPGFDWATTPQIKLRTFRPKYHLTMSLENVTMGDFLEMDESYLDRLALRRKIMDENSEATRQCNEVAKPAVIELYDWLVSTYLPRRYPMVYKPKMTVNGRRLHNTATGKDIPTTPTSPSSALYTLGENIDTDFLILLPSSTAADGSPIYHLEAFVTCFPSGFSTKEKCGMPLATIHAPVPGYAAKLERSMDRFFAKLEVGKIVKRANWSISTDGVLFCEGGNHMYGDEDKSKPPDAAALQEEIERQKLDVVVEKCWLRCERQTLHRLPKTKALVFAFKTYMYKLSEIKEEGLGPDLADAIEGLGLGNVPEMEVYKRGVVWGEKIQEYLRSP
ncbi:hypothetical protein LTR86_002253 [Recurvomyces mirabilis]|nr:hypothetical protein LTR86_002253 [Recurvomyces mirabilis]